MWYAHTVNVFEKGIWVCFSFKVMGEKGEDESFDRVQKIFKTLKNILSTIIAISL